MSDDGGDEVRYNRLEETIEVYIDGIWGVGNSNPQDIIRVCMDVLNRADNELSLSLDYVNTKRRGLRSDVALRETEDIRKLIWLIKGFIMNLQTPNFNRLDEMTSVMIELWRSMVVHVLRQVVLVLYEHGVEDCIVVRRRRAVEGTPPVVVVTPMTL